MNEKIRELLDKERELRSELNHVRHDLTMEVMNYDGSLQDALADGLVRLNFPAPSGFYRSIRRK